MPFHDNRYFDYLPVGNREFAWGLYVTGAGQGAYKPGDIYPPRDHPSLYSFSYEAGRTLPEYTLVYISEGQGEFQSEATGSVPVHAGTLFMLFPNVWHTYRPDPDVGWYEHWVALNGHYLFDLVREGMISPENPVIRPQKGEAIHRAMQRLIEAIRKRPNRNDHSYSAIAYEILAWIFSSQSDKIAEMPKEESEVDACRSIVDESLGIIWNWSYRELSVQDVADAVGINRRTLERYFREKVGSSIRDNIIECRLGRARRLLRHTDMSIKQIALAAGFPSAQRMSKLFRLVLDTTAEQYRRNYRAGFMK